MATARPNNIYKTALKKLLFQKTDGRCHYCGKELKRWTIDHLEPVSMGGIHDLYNLVPACRSCNSQKGDMNEVEFISHRISQDIIEEEKAEMQRLGKYRKKKWYEKDQL